MRVLASSSLSCQTAPNPDVPGTSTGGAPRLKAAPLHVTRLTCWVREEGWPASGSLRMNVNFPTDPAPKGGCMRVCWHGHERRRELVDEQLEYLGPIAAMLKSGTNLQTIDLGRPATRDPPPAVAQAQV